MQDRLFSPAHAFKLKPFGDSSETRFFVGEEGSLEEGEAINFYLFVRATDGIILNVSYQVFGEPLLCIAAEALCELIKGKHVLQASRVGADLIEKSLRDDPKVLAVEEKDFSQLNKVLFAFYEALEGCEDLGVSSHAYQTPLTDAESFEPIIDQKQWTLLPKEQKMALIRSILEHDIQPYVQLDDGGVDIKDLIDDKEIILLYKGSCTSCFSSIGATLQSITRILKQKIHPDLIVTPDPSVLRL